MAPALPGRHHLHGGNQGQAPELLQERTRMGLRCPLSQEQLDLAMAKLDLPPLPCH